MYLPTRFGSKKVESRPNFVSVPTSAHQSRSQWSGLPISARDGDLKGEFSDLFIREFLVQSFGTFLKAARIISSSSDWLFLDAILK